MKRDDPFALMLTSGCQELHVCRDEQTGLHAVIAGAANNQLAESRHADELAKRGIVYIPDYVINAGGLMHVISKREQRDLAQVREQVKGIGATVAQILRRAAREGRTTSDVADRMAEEALYG